MKEAITSPKRSHSALWHNTDPVSRTNLNVQLCKEDKYCRSSYPGLCKERSKRSMGFTEDSDCALKKSPWYLIEFVSIHHQGYRSKNLLTFWSYSGCVQLQWELHELKDNLKTLAIHKRLTPRNNWKFLHGWICARARWSESCVTNPLPARDFPRVCRKKKPSFRPCNGCGRTWGLDRVFSN